MEADPVKRYAKRLLPPYLTSEKPHGPINKADRSAGERAALEKRKNEVLQSLNREQIEAEYSGQAMRINKHLKRKATKNAEIDEQLAQLKDEHDMEMRVIKANLTKQDEKREADAERQQGSGSGNVGSVGSADLAPQPATKDEAKDDEHEEGEIEMAG